MRNLSAPQPPPNLIDDVRAVLYRTPDRETWADLCQLFSSPSGTGARTLELEYASQHLRSWPDNVRILPEPWVKQLVGGHCALEAPRWVLARLLILNNAALQEKEARVLAKSPALRHLRGVFLRDARLSTNGLRALSQTPHLENLVHFHLSWDTPRTEGIRALLRASWVSSLRDLGLTSIHLSPSIARELHRGNRLQNLLTLDLSWNLMDPSTIASLFVSSAWEKLRALDLSWCQIGNAGALTLASIFQLPSLRYLVLRAADLSPDSLSALLKNRTVQGLEVLDLGDNALGFEGAEKLSRRLPPNLRKLYLSSTNLGDDGLETLAETQHSPRLRRLHLEHNRLTTESIQRLSASPWASSVKHLDLRGNHLSGRALKILLDPSVWPSLKTVDLRHNRLSEESLAQLSPRAPHPTLRSLTLDQKSFSPALRQRLDKGFYPITWVP